MKLIEEKYFVDLSSASLKDKDGQEERSVIEPKCLDWVPGRFAWQLNLSRKEIRRVEEYHKLHNFLVSETESGT